MEQEVLGDYIKLSQNQENRDESRIRNIITTVQKKKECEDRALRIVELLMEGTVKPETFLKSIRYLNTSYYEDIIVERAIIQICGYPLCGKRIQPVPKKRYSISTKHNKVYDLHDHGFFCGMYCYNASNHIKNQIDNSPLWLKEYEEISNFSLLPKDQGNTGTGIDFQIKTKPAEENFTPVTSFAEVSLADFVDFESEIDEKKQFKLPTVVEGNEENDEVKHTILRKKTKKTMKTQLETVNEDSKEDKDNIPTGNGMNEKIELKADLNALLNQNSTELTEEFNSKVNVSEKTSKKLIILNDRIKTKIPKSTIKLIDPVPFKKEVTISKDNVRNIENVNKYSLKNSTEVENQLRKSFKNWISLDTLIFIHGENKVREILNENKLMEILDELKIPQLDITQQRKYKDICKKLNMQEIFEDKLDNECKTNKLKPLPDFKELKQDMKVLDIKVKTFYSGLPYETDDSNFPMKKTDKDIEGIPPVLPLADATSQNLLRRRVLFNSLHKGMKNFLDSINYKSELPLLELQELIKTFILNADNVVFKPIMWNYLGYICLKILSLRDDNLRRNIKTDKCVELENLMFQSFPGKKLVVSDTLELIQNVDKFVKTFLSQK